MAVVSFFFLFFFLAASEKKEIKPTDRADNGNPRLPNAAAIDQFSRLVGTGSRSKSGCRLVGGFMFGQRVTLQVTK